MPLSRPLVVSEPPSVGADTVTLRGLSAAAREQGTWIVPEPVRIAIQATGARVDAVPSFDPPI